MTDPNYTPTIEQVAEALGEPWAHLAPFNPPGQPDVWWWRLHCLWMPGWTVGPLYRHNHNGPAPITFSGPTRADALRAAWAYITSRQEKNP